MKLEWSPLALADLSRFAEFLIENHPSLAATIAAEIAFKAAILEQQPRIGQPILGRKKFRRIVLRAASAAYVLEYRTLGERVIIVRVFHARERRG